MNDGVPERKLSSTMVILKDCGPERKLSSTIVILNVMVLNGGNPQQWWSSKMVFLNDGDLH